MRSAGPETLMSTTQSAETEAPEATGGDGPLLDLTDAGVKRFIKQAKARGYVTMDELNKVLPSEEVTSEQIEDTLAMLSEMGVVELLSREGEIAIAKRIEAGRDTMIRGLCESALTFEAIMVWREELGSGRILLREVIDLEQTYGGSIAGPDGAPVVAPGA